MARIEVQCAAEGFFDVRVIEGWSESRHRVTLDAEYYQRLTGGSADNPAGKPASKPVGKPSAKQVSQQQLIERSFEFLLEREPKESILARFDLRVIARYFPEYEGEVRRRL